MKPHDEPHGLCSVDPITLTGLAIGALGGLGAGAASGAIGGGSSGAAAAAPAAPSAAPAAAPAPPAQAPLGNKNAPKPQQQSFIGAAATPPTQSGQKSLLGQ